ncbi:MAG: bifunctional riboflavin kinase/FAD synthetase [Rhodospirillales bacterium]|nr:bifunctional riboflavin kinase/FAD synthetase [Rhodospirillales bacterium]
MFRDVRPLPATATGAVAAVGNFDGVHRGHRAVIDAARREAALRGRPAAVLTFEPHPRRLFRPDDPPFRLTPFRVKAAILAGLGVDLMLAPRFNRRFASITAEAFVADVLVRNFGLSEIVCGADFVFGKGRGGDIAVLEELGLVHGLKVRVVDAVGDAPTGQGGQVYSSTRIRELLAAGDPKGAADLMGRPFEISGHVRHGEEIGRKLGFPTANVDHRGFLQPATGVYAIRAAIQGEDRWIDGVANFGRRPTVGGVKLLLEAHLFDFEGDLYGKRLQVRFIDYIRPEQRFDSLDALKARITEDARAARVLLKSSGPTPATDTTKQKVPL